MDRCSSLRCTPSRLSLVSQPPPASTPVSHPPRSGSRSQGWKSPAILLIVGGPRFSLCFSLFPLPLPPPTSPLLLRSALRSPYLQPSSSLPWRTGSSRSRLFIHSRFSQNNIQFCDSLDRYLERFDESASERILSR